MALSRRLRRLLWALLPATLLLAPGWRADLLPVRHEQMWDDLRSSAGAIGVARPVGGNGEEWHATYLESGLAEALESLRMRDFLPALVPPDYAAHIPAGGTHADGYYEVRTRTHWPWWWPGGGVDWRLPD